MKVPILRIPYATEDVQFIVDGVKDILGSGAQTMGRFTADFETRFATLSGVEHAIACANGTAALELILRGLGIEHRSVVVPTNTFNATAYAVTHSGNRVIWADSDPRSLSLDVEDVKRRVEADTAAVIVVHIGGIVDPKVLELAAWCESRGIHLIEDCAHAHGSTLHGRPAGSIGVAGAFSFFPTKVFTTGEGGVVTTKDAALAKRIRMLRNHGKNPDVGNRMTELGNNWRLSEFTALLGVEQMRRADAILAERNRVARYYDARLKGVKGAHPVTLAPGVASTHYKYVVHLDPRIDRAKLKATMKERHGVSLTGEVYADLCHTEPVWKTHTLCGVQRGSGHAWAGCPCDATPVGPFPGAEQAAKSHVCLPLYPGLTEQELDHVVTTFEKTLAEMMEAA